MGSPRKNGDISCFGEGDGDIGYSATECYRRGKSRRSAATLSLWSGDAWRCCEGQDEGKADVVVAQRNTAFTGRNGGQANRET